MSSMNETKWALPLDFITINIMYCIANVIWNSKNKFLFECILDLALLYHDHVIALKLQTSNSFKTTLYLLHTYWYISRSL